MEERRRQSRWQTRELLIACDRQTGACIGQIGDITESGAMLLSKRSVQPNTTIRCIVALSGRGHGDDQFNFTAESRWCRLDEESGLYQTGYEFRELTPRNLAVIRDLLEHRPVSQPETVES